MQLSKSESMVLEWLEEGEVEYQSDVSRKFDSSKRSSTAVRKLRDKGMLEREEATDNNGRSSYKLILDNNDGEESQSNEVEEKDNREKRSKASGENSDSGVQLDRYSLSEEERRAMESVMDEDIEFQSDLFESTSKSSRVVSNLQEKGLMDRVKDTHPDGYQTYRLRVVKPENPPEKEDSDSSTSSYGVSNKPDTVKELSGVHNEAFSLIQDSDVEYQSELWKRLDVGSRKGTRIARKLEEKQLIEREKVKHPDGYDTYRLESMVEDIDYSLLVSDGMITPFINVKEGQEDPLGKAFDQWIFGLQ